MNLRRSVLVGALILVSAGTQAAEPRSFAFGKWGSVMLDLPADWTAKVEGPDPQGVVTINIAPSSGAPLLLLMSPVPLPEDKKDIEQAARGVAERAAQGARKVAVEKDLPIQRLEGPGCRGYYFSATDKTVASGSAEDFKFIDQGAAAVGPRLMTFTILTNAADGPERTVAREIVKSARHVAAETPPGASAASGASGGSGGQATLTFPGKTWHLALDLPGYEIDPPAPVAGGQGATLGGKNPKTGMLITVFLEAAKPGRTAVQYRDDYWKRVQKEIPAERKDILLHQRGEAALLEFRIPKMGNMEFNHKSLNAMWVRDGVWVDVHLSKTPFTPEDQALFDQVVASAHFEE